jgi:hypothetical protein
MLDFRLQLALRPVEARAHFERGAVTVENNEGVTVTLPRKGAAK